MYICLKYHVKYILHWCMGWTCEQHNPWPRVNVEHKYGSAEYLANAVRQKPLLGVFTTNGSVAKHVNYIWSPNIRTLHTCTLLFGGCDRSARQSDITSWSYRAFHSPMSYQFVSYLRPPDFIRWLWLKKEIWGFLLTQVSKSPSVWSRKKENYICPAQRAWWDANG